VEIHGNDLKQLEKQNEGVKILATIRNGYFTGPRALHNTIKQTLDQMIDTIQQEQFTIDDIRFSSMAVAEASHLIELGSLQRCLVNTQLEATTKMYSAPIPSLDKANATWTPAAMAVDIRVGDLATQSVDMVVVCSTSQHLLEDILAKAGPEVKDDVEKAIRNQRITPAGYETAGGQLLCQSLFFLPWATEKLDDANLVRTIHAFFTTAIEYAVKKGKTSIAFPALGCGALQYNPKAIAEVILGETQRYANYNLKILIVLLEDKREAYEAFCVKLAELRGTRPDRKPTTFSYPHISE
jgi:hypothetical protein